MRRALLSLGLIVCSAAAARAQGTVSTQGFGYPAGGVSARAAAAGAAFAEFDFLSPRNPSSLLGWGRGGLYLQYEPEFRSVDAGTGSENTTTARFPLIAASVQAGSRTIVSLSSSTLLDRTWATRVRTGQILGSDSVTFEEVVSSTGALNDIRLAAARSIGEAFSVGAGVHVYTGENRMRIQRVFDDSQKYGAIDRRLTFAYSGQGVSAGATWRPHRAIALAASARAGGTLEMHLGDSVVASGKVPSRYGLGVRFDAIPGASIAVGAERTTWSRMNSLGSSTLRTRDGWEYDAGAEMTGPRVGALPMLFYVGYRTRDLPFSITDAEASERVVSLGTSFPVAGPRAVMDFALQRASRSTLQGVKEGAFILSVGFTVRP